MQPNLFGIDGNKTDASLQAMKFSFVSVEFGGLYLVNIRFIFYRKVIISPK